MSSGVGGGMVLAGRVSFLRRQDAESKKSPSKKLTWMSISGHPRRHHTPTHACHNPKFDFLEVGA